MLCRHKLNEVSTSNKCLLLRDLSLLQCFNQRVTVDSPVLLIHSGINACSEAECFVRNHLRFMSWDLVFIVDIFLLFNDLVKTFVPLT